VNPLPRTLLPLLFAASACGSDKAAPPDNASSAGSGKPPWVVEAKPPAIPTSTTSVTAHLDDKGVTMSIGGKAVGSGCAGDQGVTVPIQANGAQDFAAVGACARKLKGEPRLADETSVSVTAAWTARYQDVIGLVDALRTDAGGTIFPEFYFGVPRSALAAPSSSSAAQPVQPPAPRPPPSDPTLAPRERLPVHVLDPSADGGAGAEGVVLIVSKTQILVAEEEKPVVTYSSLAELGENGLDAAHKRNGRNDLYIVPLGQVLQRYRETDKRLREARGVEASTSELILVADADVPYRLLMEVLYTAGQSEFGKYQLMVRSGAR
jgi:biopolymer transport protein ExbD